MLYMPGLLGVFTGQDEMEDKNQETLHTEDRENNKTVTRQTRHTWIGDADEIRPQGMDRTVTRMTAVLPETDDKTTKVVERQRKAYKGFITDDEVRDAETRAEEDRKARAAQRAAREEFSQTRIYTGLGSGLDDNEEKTEPEKTRPARKKNYTFTVPTGRRLKGFIAAAVVLVLLIAFEAGFLLMKSGASKMPAKTEQIKEQTTELQARNEELQQTADALGDPEQAKELRDSWQRLVERLEE